MADARLSSFWTGLRSSKLEKGYKGEQVLTLPGGLAFPGPYQHIQQMLCRKCYKVAWEIMEADLAANLSSRFLVLGTPGIGKSMFLLYLLYRLAKEGRTVVWWAPEAFAKRAILFTPGGAFVATDPEAFEAELQDPATWFLHDAVDYPEQPAVTVMVSWPRRKWYNMFAKTIHRPLWFGPWSLCELEAARRLKAWGTPVTEEEMKSLFSKWGGIPRIVLQQAKSTATFGVYERILQKAYTVRMMKTVLEMDDAEDFVSHILLHIQADEQCKEGPVVFASDMVAKHIQDGLEFVEPEELRMFLAVAARNPYAMTVRGVFFEGYGLTAVARGGRFRVRDLSIPNSEPIILELPSVAKKHVTDLSNASVGHLLIPEQSNFPAIDGLLVLHRGAKALTPAPQVLLLQFTVATDHGIERTGLVSTLEQLPASVRAMEKAVCFVVPSDVFPKYPAQPYTAARDNEPLQRPDKEIDSIPQYALEVPLTWGDAAMLAAVPPRGSDITMADVGISTEGSGARRKLKPRGRPVAEGDGAGPAGTSGAQARTTTTTRCWSATGRLPRQDIQPARLWLPQGPQPCPPGTVSAARRSVARRLSQLRSSMLLSS